MPLTTAAAPTGANAPPERRRAAPHSGRAASPSLARPAADAGTDRAVPPPTRTQSGRSCGGSLSASGGRKAGSRPAVCSTPELGAQSPSQEPRTRSSPQSRIHEQPHLSDKCRIVWVGSWAAGDPGVRLKGQLLDRKRNEGNCMRLRGAGSGFTLAVATAVLTVGCGQSSPMVAANTAHRQQAKSATPPFVKPHSCHQLLTIAQIEAAIGRPVTASSILPCEYESHGNDDNDIQIELSFNSEGQGPSAAENSSVCPPVGRVNACFSPTGSPEVHQERVKWRGQSFLVTLIDPQEPMALARLSATLYRSMNKEVERAARTPLAGGAAAVRADEKIKRAIRASFNNSMSCAHAKQREEANEPLDNALSECPSGTSKEERETGASRLAAEGRISQEGGDVGPTTIKGVSTSGATFALTIAENGVVQTSCSPAGVGGCPGDGRW
jgi:hypothetical protein